MKLTKLRSTSLVTSAIFITGCATAPGTPGGNSLNNQFKQTFASDDPCSNNARNIGIVGGAVLGVVLANAMGGGKDKSKLVGLALGSALGGFIGADMDRKRCELSKVAKKYDLDITYANIEVQGNVTLDSGAAKPTSNSPPNSDTSNTVIGNTVAVRDKDGAASHFVSGSDNLTPRAKEYFAAIAVQYAPETLLVGQADPTRKEELRKQLGQRHILLVGHTDDTGSSQANANLSERRAHTVASFLKQKGVSEASIYYQGAGEIFPIADNKTESGRAANRRVEIVEVSDEDGFKKYLDNRKPNLANYRPAQVEPLAAAATVANATKTSRGTKVAVGAAKSAVKTGATQSSTPSKIAKVSIPTAPAAITAPGARYVTDIDFGGTPVNGQFKAIDIGSATQKSTFSIISSAHADEMPMGSCAQDRPRIRGDVKSLDGKAYKTAEYLPGAAQAAWGAQVNGHYVGMTQVSVLRDGGKPSEVPTVLIYKNWQPGSKQPANIKTRAEVNAYQGEKALLYRAFPVEGPVRCIDMVIAKTTPYAAPESNLVYHRSGVLYQANYTPTITR